jgi:hypothetical protein
VVLLSSCRPNKLEEPFESSDGEEGWYTYTQKK